MSLTDLRKKLVSYCDNNRVLNPCVVSFMEEILQDLDNVDHNKHSDQFKLGTIYVPARGNSPEYVLLQKPDHNGYAKLYNTHNDNISLCLIDPPIEHNRDPNYIPKK